MDALGKSSGVVSSVTRRVEPDGELAKERKQIVATKRWVREVEEWCKRQTGRAPTFSEAVRYLTERGMRADDADKRTPPKTP